MKKILLTLTLALAACGCGGTPNSDAMQVGRKGGYATTNTAADGGAPDFHPAPNNLTLPGELAKDPGPYTGR